MSDSATILSGNGIASQGGKMARKRFQRGMLLLRGKKGQEVWVARWREDNPDGTRSLKSQVLGDLKDLQTKRLAYRELDRIMARVNADCEVGYRQLRFTDMAERWKLSVLPQHKPSSQNSEKVHINCHLIPYFGEYNLNQITPELVQRFVSQPKIHPKTLRNIFATFRLVWRAARTWGYTDRDVTTGIVLPRNVQPKRKFFTAEQARQIIEEAEEPFRTFFWIVAETGMRAGEMCGLRTQDLHLDIGIIAVRQSAWRTTIQLPKTANAVRTFPISPELAEHLREYLKYWTANELDLLFATKNGQPLDSRFIVRDHLQPLLTKLKIPRAGLHAFRHTNASAMDSIGAPMKVRQERLGHSNALEMTIGVYTHADSADHRRVAAELGHIFAPKSRGFVPNREFCSQAEVEELVPLHKDTNIGYNKFTGA
jgi:integrase